MKPVILLFIGQYLPGYKAGGPTQTIANMINAIGNDYAFYIVTTDRDIDDKSPYSGIRHHEWMKIGNCFVRYLSPQEQTFFTFKKIIQETDFDIVYCQSFFDSHYTILPLVSLFFSQKRVKPVLLAPRGEFASGALAHHGLRKRFYLFFFKTVFINLLKYTFQCSSADEKKDLEHLFGKDIPSRIALDFNSQEHIAESSLDVPITEPLKIVLLARIDIQKNIDYAIKVVSKINFPVIFDIYGNPFDKQYALKCFRLTEHMPDYIHVSLKGAIPHCEVLQLLQKYDLFFMPTKNENFGHVIHEALLAGLPVLISDRTPWHELHSRNAGWEVPLDNPDLFLKRLNEFKSLTNAQRIQMRYAALNYGMDVSNNQQTFRDNTQMFESLLIS